MADLTSTQRAAVDQLKELTNAEDEATVVSVLEGCEWDVGRAADMIFGGGINVGQPAGPSSTEKGAPESNEPLGEERRMEQFDIDDSEQDSLLRRPPPPSPHISPSNVVYNILTYPFRFLANIFRFVFSVLRIPLPRFGPFLSLNFYSRSAPAGRITPNADYGGPDRWIRELEEETGAVCLSRANASTTSGVAGPSSSGLTSRNRGNSGERILPDFTLESYEQTLRRAQKEAKIACIILVSEEHDDVAEFKRSTLTDPTFVHALARNDVIVYGGDVRSVDAYGASEKLNATTYPFVAFISPQPPRADSFATPSVTILSRHQGAAQTTANVLTQQLTGTVLPRVETYLNSRREIERSRQLREEQDRAFEESKRRDTNRIKQKIEEDKRREREAQEAERQRLLDEEIALLESAKAEERKEERMRWRRYMRRTVVPKESPPAGLRVAVRFQDGSRVVRMFSPESDTLTTLYAFVDTQAFIPQELEASTDPELPPTSLTIDELAEAESGFWGFKLATAYPRKEIPWQANMSLKDVQELGGGGAQLVIEADTHASNGHGNGKGKGTDNQSSDDEYETESDED